MKPTAFDELFWFSDPESMGRMIHEKYNLTDFYNADISFTLYQRAFLSQEKPTLPKITITRNEHLKPIFEY